MKRVILLSMLLSFPVMQAQKAILYGLVLPWTAEKPAEIDSDPEDKAKLAAFLAVAAERSEEHRKAAPLFRTVEKMFKQIGDTGEEVGRVKLGFLYGRFSPEVVEASKAISLEARGIMLEHGLATEEGTKLWHGTLGPECNRSNPCLAMARTLAWVNHWG